MATGKSKQPTNAELEVLAVLWEKGPSTVREVHEALSEGKSAVYTTTLKIMQNMTEKGLLLRNDSAFRHIYRPAVSEARTQKQIVNSLADRAFAGSAGKLVLRALSAKKISADELAEIQKLIDEMGET